MSENALDRQSALGRAAYISAAIYLFVLPFGHMTALRNVCFGVSLLCCILLWAQSSSKDLPLKVTFSLWIFAASVSLIWTLDSVSSIESIKQDILKSVATFFIFYILTKDYRTFQLWATVTGLCILTIFVIAAVTVPLRGTWEKGYLPPRGEFATIAITVIPLLLCVLVTRLKKEGLVYPIAVSSLLAATFAGYLTMSRAFWLSLICIAVVTFVFLIMKRREIKLGVFIAMAILVVASIVLAASVANQRGRTLHDFEDRSAIYPQVIEKIAQNPWHGTGFGHETNKQWLNANVKVNNTHNIVLSYFDQLGVIGLLVMTLLFFSAIPRFYSAWRGHESRVGTIGLFGIAMVIAVFVKNNFDVFFVRQPLWIFFAHLGMYLGLINSGGRDQESPKGTTAAEDNQMNDPQAKI